MTIPRPSAVRTTARSTAALALVAALTATVLPACGNKQKSVSAAVAIANATYLIYDIDGNTLTPALSVPDLVTNADYRTIKIVFRLVASGTSAKGSPGGSFAADPISEPVGTASNPRNVYVAVFETTQGQWKRLAGATVTPWNDVVAPGIPGVGGASIDDELPAYAVSKDFALEVTGKTLPYGFKLDLPTRDQWEFFARGGVAGNTLFSWGDSRTVATAALYAVTAETEAGGTVGPKRIGLSRQPNGFGLYDMHGNVWEWVKDADMVRGGSWHDGLAQARSANTFDADPGLEHPLVGVRFLITR